ncbi:MAG: CoA transferase [Actinomycetota bacterium]|nr:CoA transferase [Actinomycetota bacterium]MDG1488955.1 CoA transferase [Actinomycetota bacterium]MDG2119978.1 CoA transferase [Actinomycetota bacterium]
MSGALDGIRVLDLSTLVQGPQAAAMLHDLGAEVIKIELPDVGDMGRHVGVIEDLGTSVFWEACNRGKRSVTLDLRTEAGHEAFLKLVQISDVVLSNFQPGTLDGWNLGYDDLAAVNPRIIWAAGSFLGPSGPDALREGADIVGEAAGGVIAGIGNDDEPATTVASLLADHCGSQNLQTGVLAALFARERTGRGQRIDVSLLGGQIWMQAPEYTHYFLTGELAGRSNGGHPLVHALYGVFPTSDGALAMAGCPEHLWEGMCRAIEKPEWSDHPTYNQYFVTKEIAREMRQDFIEIFSQRPTAEWVERLSAEEQRFSPVRSHDEVAADPQSFANGYIVEVDHPQFGKVNMVGCPIQMSDTPTRFGVEAQQLGQDTEMVLVEAGYEWEELEGLRERGAW